MPPITKSSSVQNLPEGKPKFGHTAIYLTKTNDKLNKKSIKIRRKSVSIERPHLLPPIKSSRSLNHSPIKTGINNQTKTKPGILNEDDRMIE